MMKKTQLLLTALLLIGACAHAQEKEEGMRYLLEDGIQITGFGGPTVSFGQVENEFAVFSGGGGAMLINHQFYIGGFGEGLATRHKRNNVSVDGDELKEVHTNFGYGGLWTGYIHQPNNLLHLRTSVKIAAGALTLADSFETMYDELYHDVVFVAIPSAGVEINILPWFRVSLDAGYRHVGGLEKTVDDNTGLRIFNSNDYTGLHTKISLLFGAF